MSGKAVFRVCALCLFYVVSLSAFGHKYSVPPAYEEIAQETGVPKKILYAVAMVESRKNHQGIYRPWPWTLNVRGEAMYFNTKQEAINAVNKEIASGNVEVAIGIMQIYWRYHKKMFSSPGELLDPQTNVAYGAKYLRQLHNENGDWFSAVGQYYSGRKTPEGIKKANEYASKVVVQWEKLY